LGPFPIYLDNLTQGTTYYARAFATNSNGTAYGNEVSFTTLNPPSTPVTSPATSITSNTAVISSTISTANGNQITERGICYNNTPNPTIDAYKINGGAGIGSYTISMSGDSGLLNSNTTYYVRSYLITVDNVIYGNQISFTTLSVGQNGQAGIVVFDKGVYSNGWRYLETFASDSLNTDTLKAIWGCKGISISGLNDGIGRGQSNTTAIINACGTSGIAARLCDNFSYGGKSDWFLPSKDELRVMGLNFPPLGSIRIFPIGLSSSFWSSSQKDIDYSYINKSLSFNFSFGIYDNRKDLISSFKPVRVF